MNTSRHIAVAIERTSAYGRRFLQGVANFFDGRADFQLDLLDPKDITPQATRQYDGWICRVTNSRILQQIAKTGKPVVDAICLDFNESFSTIRTDYTSIGRLAAEHFLSHRFPNFAFCGYRNVTFSDRRGKAFSDVLADQGHQTHIYRQPKRIQGHQSALDQQLLILEGSTGEAADAAALLDWIRGLPKPVAVFCCDDFRAAAVARLCKRNALAIPQDVAILGVDNDPVFCLFGTPRLSSIDPDAFAIGTTAAEMMLELLDAPTSKAKVLSRMIPPKGLVVRASSDTYPGSPPWFTDALSFIANNIATGISATDVFAHVGFSRTHVEQIFRKQLDRTVQGEIARQRIEKAKRLLTTTTLSIKNIARQAGYASVEYFTRKFSNATGQSPAKYRVQL